MPHLTALWRYTVSSMAGERLDSVSVGVTGLDGDRAWGVYDRSAERIAYPGREPRSYAVPRGHARLTADGGCEVSTDGRAWLSPVAASSLAELSALFGFPAVILPYRDDGFEPRYKRAPIHLVTTASIRSLQRVLPNSVIDERRFRPNLLVEIADGAEAFPETQWLGREIRVGKVVLKGSVPCGRCGFTTLEQDGLPLDVEVLRTITRTLGRNFGIYCDVVVPGRINAGDHVTIE